MDHSTSWLVASLVGLAALAPGAHGGPADRVRIPLDLGWEKGRMDGVHVVNGGLELTDGRSRGEYVSPVLRPQRRAELWVPYWNTTTAGAGRVLIQAQLFDGDQPVGPWITVSDWGRWTRGPHGKGNELVAIDQDTLKCAAGCDGIALRLVLERRIDGSGPTGEGAGPVDPRPGLPAPIAGTESPRAVPRVHLIGALAFSSSHQPTADLATTRALSLPVPFRSQTVEHSEIAGRICGPTSLSMALAYHGRPRPTAEVARRASDPDGAIEFGNWAYLAAAAGEMGFQAEVASFDSFEPVHRELEEGRPVVMSVRYKKGELTGAPAASTSGHLILVRGLARSGRVLVNDPAGRTPRQGRRSYDRVQLARAWGRGIVILISRRH